MRFDLLYILHASSCNAFYAANGILTGHLAVFRIEIKKGKVVNLYCEWQVGEVADTIISYFNT